MVPVSLPRLCLVLSLLVATSSIAAAAVTCRPGGQPNYTLMNRYKPNSKIGNCTDLPYFTNNTKGPKTQLPAVVSLHNGNSADIHLEVFDKDSNLRGYIHLKSSTEEKYELDLRTDTSEETVKECAELAAKEVGGCLHLGLVCEDKELKVVWWRKNKSLLLTLPGKCDEASVGVNSIHSYGFTELKVLQRSDAPTTTTTTTTTTTATTTTTDEDGMAVESLVLVQVDTGLVALAVLGSVGLVALVVYKRLI